MIWNIAVIFLSLLLPTEGILAGSKQAQDWYGYQYSAINHTSHKSQRHCAYVGYTPLGAPKFDVDETKTAYLQTDILNCLWTETSTPISFGLTDAVDNAQNAGYNFRQWSNGKVKDPEKTVSWFTKHAKALKAVNVVSKLFKFAAILSPAAGIISAIIGGIAGVGSPTPEDILKEANKAIDKLSDEVDRKLERLRGYVDEKIIDLEKDLNQRKYKFLFAYWTMCVTEEEEEVVNSCQRTAYNLILASENEFLLYHDRMDKEVEGKRKIPEDALTMEERQRIEVGMMAFRNYALLSLTCIKTLLETYRKIKENDKDNKKICEELRQEQKVKLDAGDEEYKPDPDFLRFCKFQEELTAKTVYYEIYGFAAIEEIKVVASYRLLKDPIFDEPTTKFHNHKEWKESDNGWNLVASTYYWDEKRVTCSAYVDPRIKDPSKKCTFDVQLVEQGEKYKDPKGTLKTGKSWYGKNLTADYWKSRYMKVEDDTVSSEIGYSEGSLTVQWCHNLIRIRRKEYNAMEQPDIDRYWNTAVMSLIRCGKLLSDGTVFVCLPSEMKDNFPEGYGARIPLDHRSAKSDPKTDKETGHPKRVVDGLAYSYGEFTSPWTVELKSPAYVTKVFVYFPEDGFKIDWIYKNNLLDKFGSVKGLEVKTKETKDDKDGKATSQWVKCDDNRLPLNVDLRVQRIYNKRFPRFTADFPYEVVVQCHTSTPVEALQVTAQGTFYLTNVLVEGYHEPAGPADPDEFPMEFKNPQITGGKRVDEDGEDGEDGVKRVGKHYPYAAVDGQMTTTMEIEKYPNTNQVAFTVEMKTVGVVSLVKIYFKGSHTKLSVGLKSSADEVSWTPCGVEEEPTATGKLTDPFTASCETKGKPATYAIEIKSGEFLRIREIQVKGIKVGSGRNG